MGLFSSFFHRENVKQEDTDEASGHLRDLPTSSSPVGGVSEPRSTLTPFTTFFGQAAPNQEFDGTVANFIDQLGGRSFGDGLIRSFNWEEKMKWEQIVRECIPTDNCDYELFSFAWDGACFGVEAAGEKSTILLFDIGDLKCKPVPMTLTDFLNVEIPGDCDGYLAANSYQKWLKTHPAPKRSECVGHKIPLFLGGRDDFDNMEIIDMQVQWEMTAQIWQAVRDLPPGTPIGSIRFE